MPSRMVRIQPIFCSPGQHEARDGADDQADDDGADDAHGAASLPAVSGGVQSLTRTGTRGASAHISS